MSEDEATFLDKVLDDVLDDADGDNYIGSTKGNNKSSKISGGSFKTMGLLNGLLKCIERKGYRQPTPIQRKSIPVLLKGKDILGMARTGSGKTAAFIIPMLQKLKTHSAKVGARALILSPTRELALQTFKVIKEMAKFSDLRVALIVGGDNLEDQFLTMSSNPDIVVAAPGRFVHLCVEMNLDLKSVEYVVFDEADRLFEMGFAPQLNEILSLLPSSRQTSLFSATLPNSLMAFAKAGLKNPTLIKLDTETKINPDLKMLFFSVKQDYKEAALLLLLRLVVPSDASTIIFVSTKHHVEYINDLLQFSSYKTSVIYGSMDQSARVANLNDFQSKKTNILIVTDVAARGIDIPILDYVINYDFPGKPKLFVHRVGRAARAGRQGTAMSLVSADELPYLLDFQLFLGRPLFVDDGIKEVNQNFSNESLLLGNIPQFALDLEHESVVKAGQAVTSVEAMREVSRRAFKLYLKTRPTASAESHKRCKGILHSCYLSHSATVHPILKDSLANTCSAPKESAKAGEILKAIRGFKPTSTVFEMSSVRKKSPDGQLAADIMKKRRLEFDSVIASAKRKCTDINAEITTGSMGQGGKQQQKQLISNENLEEDDDDAALFDADDFLCNLKEASFDIAPDDKDDLVDLKRKRTQWDKKKKKFVTRFSNDENDGKQKVAKKKGTFEQWSQKNKIPLSRVGEQEQAPSNMKAGRYYRHTSMKLKKADLVKNGKPRSELKNPEQILKQRKEKQFRKARTGRHWVGKQRKAKK